uniref:Uncharacterized protein n=2 Tax=Brassica oleracea TaxID=3712 RepID=A0A0D3AYI2_BRAOL
MIEEEKRLRWTTNQIYSICRWLICRCVSGFTDTYPASPLRLRIILSDESPRRHEKLTEGVNLKSVSFMSQFHSSRPDCNLYASWVRFLQTKKYCVLLYIKEKILKKLSKQQLSPLCDLDQALRFACVDRGQTENSCCSQTENICCVKCPNQGLFFTIPQIQIWQI